MILAVMFGVMALGFLGAAILQITKARWGLVAVFAVLAFAFGGVAGVLGAGA
jgi:hypothetical protein